MTSASRVFVTAVALAFLLLGVAGRSFAADEAKDVAAEKSDVAADVKTFTLTLQNHVFTPASVEVPAGQKIVLHVINQDDAVEEFESHDLKREKTIPAKGSIKVTVGPLKAGTYSFVGEFHEDTAKGTLIAVQ